MYSILSYALAGRGVVAADKKLIVPSVVIKDFVYPTHINNLQQGAALSFQIKVFKIQCRLTWSFRSIVSFILNNSRLNEEAVSLFNLASSSFTSATEHMVSH